MNPCDTPLSPFAEVIKGYKIFLGGISCAVCASCCLTLTVTKACGGAPAIICKGSAVSHFTIVSLFSHGCSRFTARCGSRLCFCLLFLPLPARCHDGKQKQCRPDEAKGSPTGRAGGATSIKCTAVQTLASFCCTDIFTLFQSSTQRQYFFQSLR